MRVRVQARASSVVYAAKVVSNALGGSSIKYVYTFTQKIHFNSLSPISKLFPFNFVEVMDDISKDKTELEEPLATVEA